MWLNDCECSGIMMPTPLKRKQYEPVIFLYFKAESVLVDLR